MTHHLAQVNIGRLKVPLDSPRAQAFVDGLSPVNTLAEATDGFVWRLQTDDGNATALRVFDDPAVLINLSVWESVQALSQFTYRGEHGEFFSRKRDWFVGSADVQLALWWVPIGHRPTVEDAKHRLDLLRDHGPTPDAFTFRHVFPVPR